MFLYVSQMTLVSGWALITTVNLPARATIMFQTIIDHSNAVQRNWNGLHVYPK